MKILGIDSSTPQSCSAAFLENQTILSQAEITFDTPRSDHILTLVDKVLAGSRLEEIDGFAVTSGPGSFTGLRASAGILKGFVLATEKPFMGVNTLEALAALAAPTPCQICAILDAKKNEVYAAFFNHGDDRPTRLSKDQVMPPTALPEAVSVPTLFIGNGVRTYGDMLSTTLGDLYLGEPETKKISIAASVALLAFGRFASEKSFDLDSLQINYIRKSEAEIKLRS